MENITSLPSVPTFSKDLPETFSPPSSITPPSSSFSLKKELFLACFFLALTCVGIIWVRTLTVKETYKYVLLEKEYRQLEQIHQAIRMQWLKLTAPKRLDSLAKDLNLHPAKINQIIQYGNSSKKP